MIVGDFGSELLMGSTPVLYILDVNDKLVNNTKRSISRTDVANLCVAALLLDPNDNPNDNNNESHDSMINCIGYDSSSTSSTSTTKSSPPRRRKQLALDCVTQPPLPISTTTSDVKTAEQALREFIKDKTKIYDYSL